MGRGTPSQPREHGERQRVAELRPDDQRGAQPEDGLEDDHARPGLRQAADRAFAVLRRSAEALSARLPRERRPPAQMMALHIWAMSHGIASLFARADAGRRTLPMAPEELLEAGMLVYLRGLGLMRDETGKP